MDNLVDSLNKALQDFISAAAAVLKSKARADANKTADVDTALENVKEKWELFKVACDKAEEFVRSAKQRIGSEFQVNEAKGPVVGMSGEAANTGFVSNSLISILPLEQMSESVRWLLKELENGAGSSSAANAANSQPSGPLVAKFPEDGSQ